MACCLSHFQWYSTLSENRQPEKVVDAYESSTIAVLVERAVLTSQRRSGRRPPDGARRARCCRNLRTATTSAALLFHGSETNQDFVSAHSKQRVQPAKYSPRQTDR